MLGNWVENINVISEKFSSAVPIWVFNAFNVLEGMSFVSTAY